MFHWSMAVPNKPSFSTSPPISQVFNPSRSYFSVCPVGRSRTQSQQAERVERTENVFDRRNRVRLGKRGRNRFAGTSASPGRDSGNYILIVNVITSGLRETDNINPNYPMISLTQGFSNFFVSWPFLSICIIFTTLKGPKLQQI